MTVQSRDPDSPPIPPVPEHPNAPAYAFDPVARAAITAANKAGYAKGCADTRIELEAEVAQARAELLAEIDAAILREASAAQSDGRVDKAAHLTALAIDLAREFGGPLP